ncbi:hypothetical protein AB0J84_02725 [Micromonospora arborensis]|uniref:hypothetical protein n=1 Tax=Micromonospora arborensis TaxID=2116518 RepID=UPI00342FBD35
MPVMVTNYRDLFASVARRPRMYLLRDDFPTTVAYIEGCDQGNAHRLLSGFREWLLTQVGCGDNHVWWSLVLRLAVTTGQAPDDLSPDNDAKAKETLFRLLDEFLELIDERDGLSRIYAAYDAWRAARTEHGCQATDEPSCPRVDWPRAASYTDAEIPAGT